MSGGEASIFRAQVADLRREIEDRERRKHRALNRLLLLTLLTACSTLGAVPAIVMTTGNLWLVLLIIPAILIPVGFQQLGFHWIDRKYGAR